MNSDPPKTEKDLSQDLKTFEALPAKTKEAVILQDRAAKATGPESVVLAKKIQAKSKVSA